MDDDTFKSLENKPLLALENNIQLNTAMHKSAIQQSGFTDPLALRSYQFTSLFISSVQYRMGTVTNEYVKNMVIDGKFYHQFLETILWRNPYFQKTPDISETCTSLAIDFVTKAFITFSSSMYKWSPFARKLDRLNPNLSKFSISQRGVSYP